MILRLLAASLLVMSAANAQAAEAHILSADFGSPTTRYDHGVLGDSIEWGSLTITFDGCGACAGPKAVTFTLPDTRVFEDFAPRVVPGLNSTPDTVMVVETDLEQGARMALYTPEGLFAATPFIGQTHRWLAPIGAADLDGDGVLEFAYIDRPHLLKTLRVWRPSPTGTLSEVGSLVGYTNHKIGQTSIAGGIRDCGKGPEMIVADAKWSKIYAVQFSGKEFAASALRPHNDRDSFAQALACKD